MNIKLSSFLSDSVFVFKESFLPALNSQNKKILIVAALAFVLLAACYAVSCYLYKAKPLNDAKDLLNGKERNNIPLENKVNKDELDAEKVKKSELHEKLLDEQGVLPLANGNELTDDFKGGTLDGQGTPNDDQDVEGFNECKLVTEAITYRDPPGKIEQGDFKNVKLNNEEKIIYSNGDEEQVTFKESKLNGNGSKTFSDGGFAEGEFKDGELVTGKITYNDPTGRIEQGEFKDRKLNGEGEITYSNGEVEKGIFKEGKLNGKGKKSFYNGDESNGEFKDGELVTGTITYRDPLGRIEQGDFKDGKLNGEGKIIYSNGEEEQGVFKEGRLDGNGKKTFSDDSFAEGEFKKGELIKGMITYKDPSGRIESGEFKDRKLNGEGKIIYSNRDVERGIFKDGKLNGKGKKSFYNGDESYGEFKDGELITGYGVILIDGNLAHGDIINGKLVTGEIIFKGGKKEEFKNSELVKITTERGTKKEFKKGELVKITTINGLVSEGEFKDGVLVNGICSDKPFFQKFKNGKLVRMRYYDGSYAEGEFKGDSLVTGKICYDGGLIVDISGDWNNDNLFNGLITLTSPDKIVLKLEIKANTAKIPFIFTYLNHDRIREVEADGKNFKITMSNDVIEEGTCEKNALYSGFSQKNRDEMVRLMFDFGQKYVHFKYIHIKRPWNFFSNWNIFRN